MSIAFVASTIQGSALGGAGATTSAITTTGANLIVLSLAYFGSTAPTITDSKGNTWTALTQYSNASTYSEQLFYCAAPTVGTGHTFTFALGGTYGTLYVLAVSGASASPVDQQGGATSGGATSLQPGSITPSQAGCLVVAGLNAWTGTTATVNGSFTANLRESDFVASSSVCSGGAYVIQGGDAAVNPSWSWTTSGQAATAIASFLPGLSGMDYDLTDSSIYGHYVQIEGGGTLQSGSFNYWDSPGAGGIYPDLAFRFRGTITRIDSDAYQNGAAVRLTVDGVDTATATLPGGNTWGTHPAYNTLFSGLDGTAEHEYRVTFGNGAYFTALQVAGTGLNTSALAARTVVACYGDSITDGEYAGGSDSTVSWVHKLAGLGPYDAVNRGIAGSYVYSTGTSGEARTSDITSLSPAPDIVVVLYGANDVINSVSLSNFQTAYQTMVADIRAGLPGALIVCERLLKQSIGDTSVDPYSAKIAAVVTALADPRIVYAQGAWGAYDGSTGVHPNGAQCTPIAAAVLADIQAGLGAPYLADWFVGSAGALAGRVSDSGDTWGPSGNDLISLNGTGGVYYSGSFTWGQIAYTDWTPPGANYSVKMVAGAGASAGSLIPCVRCTGANPSVTGYAANFDPTPEVQFYRVIGGTETSLVSGTPIAALNADDVVELQVSTSGSTVNLTALINGTVVATYTDSNGSAITATGSAGMMVVGGTGQDICRGLWAGAIGGPTEAISPTSATIVVNHTQSFSATGALTNETLNWTATHGSISGPPGSTVTYTAPATGLSDVVTWASADLPTRSETATITLVGSPFPTRKRGFSPARRAAFIAGLMVHRPEKSVPISNMPPLQRPGKAAQPAPPERPAIADARSSKAKLDFPLSSKR